MIRLAHYWLIVGKMWYGEKKGNTNIWV